MRVYENRTFSSAAYVHGASGYGKNPCCSRRLRVHSLLRLDVEDGEVYVTRTGTPLPKTIEEMRKMKIALVKGYHYKFIGFEADEKWMKKRFVNIEFTEDPAGCLNLVLRGISDLTIVAKSFIYDFLKKNPSSQGKVSISDNYDTVYKLGVILNPEGQISRAKLEPLIDKLKKNPEFQKLINERFQLK